MTDYNDGKWHGWNGGECPVHPKSLVDVRFYEAAFSETPPTVAADNWDWDDPDCVIVAFRVVKPFREPRQWWVVGAELFRMKADAILWADEGGFDRDQVIHVREVLE